MDMPETRPEMIIFGNRQEFAEIFLPDLAPVGGVFVHTDREYSLGESLRIYLFFPEIPEGILLFGRVAWRRLPTKWRSALLPGIGVSLYENCRERLDFLLNFCTGELDDRRRRGKRIPGNFRVKYLLSGHWILASAKNISREGIFINTTTKILPATPLEMKLYIDKPQSTIRYHGKVAWRHQNGDGAGIGVQFQFTNPVGRNRILRFVRDSEDDINKRIRHIVSRNSSSPPSSI